MIVPNVFDKCHSVQSNFMHITVRDITSAFLQV